jgi:hypothetical protein
MPVGTSLNQVLAPIREVTTLAPTGAGSLHEALTADAMGAGAIIDFDVAGNINRIGMADLMVEQPGFQIRGETAPGDGINLVGCGIRVKRSGAVLRNFRIVPGDKGGNVPNPDNRDCIGVEGESQPIEDILIEGMSLAYSIDGLLDLFSSNRIKRVTIRRNIFAEPLDASTHPSGSHATALLIAKGEDVLVQENLFAHIRYRAPAIRGASNVAVVNNLYYNCADQHWQLYGGDANQSGGTVLLAIIGNHAIAGRNMPWWRAAGHYEPLQVGMSAFPATRIHMSDNQTTWHADFVNGNAGLGITARAQYSTTDAFPTNTAVMAALGYSIISPTNVVDLGSVSPMARGLVQAHVLANAGPRKADGTLRNTIFETRIRAEVADGRTGTLKNTVPAAEAALFGFPSDPVPTYGDIDDAPILAGIKALAESMYPVNQTTDTTLVPSVTRDDILAVLDTLNVGAGQPLATVDAVRVAAMTIAAKAEALIESIDRQRANNGKPSWQG